jgi:hypothetical protein
VDASLDVNDDESTFTFNDANIQRRFKSLGQEVPTAVSSRGDLVALITEVGRQQATSSGSTSPAFANEVAQEDDAPDRTIAELKSRLKELV